MDKYTELEKEAQKFLDETDTMQFSMVELLTMFYRHNQQLTLTDVSHRRELLNFLKWYDLDVEYNSKQTHKQLILSYEQKFN